MHNKALTISESVVIHVKFTAQDKKYSEHCIIYMSNNFDFKNVNGDKILSNIIVPTDYL